MSKPKNVEFRYYTAVIGFSHGGDAARVIASQLDEKDCTVDLLFLIDPIKYPLHVDDPDVPLPVTDNVSLAVNYFQRQQLDDTIPFTGGAWPTPARFPIGFTISKEYPSASTEVYNYLVTAYTEDDMSDIKVPRSWPVGWPYHSYLPMIVICPANVAVVNNQGIGQDLLQSGN